jgi:hypothetical protein
MMAILAKQHTTKHSLPAAVCKAARIRVSMRRMAFAVTGVRIQLEARVFGAQTVPIVELALASHAFWVCLSHSLLPTVCATTRAPLQLAVLSNALPLSLPLALQINHGLHLRRFVHFALNALRLFRVPSSLVLLSAQATCLVHLSQHRLGRRCALQIVHAILERH